MSTVWRIKAGLPDFIVRDLAQTIELAVYDASGTLTAPTSGTLTLYAEDGTKVVDAQAITVASSKATYSLTAADLPTTYNLSERWSEEWDLLISGESVTFRRAAHLVRSNLFPTVTAADLDQYHQNLSRLIKTGNDADDFVGLAWEKIQRRLLKQGRMPWLILSPYVLTDALALKSLELIFRDAHTSAGDGKYLELADYYRSAHESEWATIALDQYDTDEDGLPNDEPVAAQAPLYMGGPGVYTSWLP